MTLIDFFKLIAGISIFLFGMFQIEESLKQLAGRTFKLFLRKHTERKISAIINGTIITGLLQSSSVVSFMVMSFVGAGVISMRNALAIVFGSNLGTTINNWVLATLGFKYSIDNFSFIIIAIAGIGLALFSNKKKLFHFFIFLMGFGLLFFGLGFIQQSLITLVHNFNFAAYKHVNNLTFLFIGFILTAIIQSSSATMALSLSALHVGIIPFDTAVSVVIGSELGTSIKIILGALDGIVDKKRLAYGNVIFNIVITFFSFVFMYPLIGLIKTVFQIKEPLIGLVLFQTIINLFGILLFIPFLDSFEKFLQKIVQQKNGSTTYFIQNTNPLVATLALEVIEKETLLFIHRIINLNLEAFNINDVEIKKADFLNGIREKNKNITYSEKYDKIKHAEGEILSVFTKISEDKIEKDDFIRLNQLISSIRNAMYSAKGIKNIEHDRKELSDSIIEIKYEQYKFIQTQLREFYKNLNQLLNSNDQLFCSKELIRLMNQIQNEYEIRLNNIYKHSEKNTLEETEISTLLNVSREVYSSCKAIIFSLKDYLLTPQKAEEFDNAPLVIIN